MRKWAKVRAIEQLKREKYSRKQHKYYYQYRKANLVDYQKKNTKVEWNGCVCVCYEAKVGRTFKFSNQNKTASHRKCCKIPLALFRLTRTSAINKMRENETNRTNKRPKGTKTNNGQTI